MNVKPTGYFASPSFFVIYTVVLWFWQCFAQTFHSRIWVGIDWKASQAELEPWSPTEPLMLIDIQTYSSTFFCFPWGKDWGELLFQKLSSVCFCQAKSDLCNWCEELEQVIFYYNYRFLSIKSSCVTSAIKFSNHNHKSAYTPGKIHHLVKHTMDGFVAGQVVLTWTNKNWRCWDINEKWSDLCFDETIKNLDSKSPGLERCLRWVFGNKLLCGAKC